MNFSKINYFRLFVKKFIYVIFLQISTNIFSVDQNPRIINSVKFVPTQYNRMPEDYKKKIMQSIYDNYVNKYNSIEDAEFLKISYLSDGLKISGFLIKPKLSSKKVYPLVIYNRGGYGDTGKLDVISLCEEIYFLVKCGYTVLASQYRGNDGSEGKDECGGADINDVLNLFKLAKTLDFVDNKNIFMLGFSRGGIMTYLALKHGVLVNAAATIAGITDMFMFARMHPELEKQILGFLPDLAKDKENEYAKRSVVHWSQSIDKPILLIHNNEDKLVSVEQSITFAKALRKDKKAHELVIYQDDKHSLNKYREDAQKRILQWFERFKV